MKQSEPVQECLKGFTATEISAGVALLRQLATLRAGMKRDCSASVQLLVVRGRFAPVVSAIELLRHNDLLPEFDDDAPEQDKRASYLG